MYIKQVKNCKCTLYTLPSRVAIGVVKNLLTRLNEISLKRE